MGKARQARRWQTSVSAGEQRMARRDMKWSWSGNVVSEMKTKSTVYNRVTRLWNGLTEVEAVGAGNRVQWKLGVNEEE